MNKVIKYLNHNFVVFDEENDYAEFNCMVCNHSAALKYITYNWYHNIWDKLDISCEEVLIKKLLE